MHFRSKSFFLFTVLLCLPFLTYAQKTDTLIHINGNVMTGEIKKMTNGILYFKMSGMGTISVEAEKIRTYKSRKLLQIRTLDGNLIFGDVDTSFKHGYLKIGFGVNKEEVHVLDIVELFPIKSTFWLRMSGDFDLGLDYAKSTDMARLNTSGQVYYRKQKLLTGISWSTIASVQGFSGDTSIVNEKADAIYSFKRMIKGRWLWVGNLGVNSNSELGLDLRILLGGSIQNDIVLTTRNHFYWQLGVNINREYPSDGDILDNPEGFMAVSYDIYKFSRPEISLSSNVSAYPNLTFNGRWRLNTDINLKLELFYNFFIGFSIYSNYDSKPASDGASTTDWGSSFSIGYSFH